MSEREETVLQHLREFKAEVAESLRPSEATDPPLCKSVWIEVEDGVWRCQISSHVMVEENPPETCPYCTSWAKWLEQRDG